MKKIKIFNRPIIFVLLIYIYLIILANVFGVFCPENNSFLFYNTNKRTVSLTGKIITEPVQKNKNQQFVFEVFDIDGQPIKKEKTLVYGQKAYKVEYGDIVCLTGRLSVPEKPLFPYNFDYNLYLQRENIYTTFSQYGFEFIDKNPNKIKQISLKIRDNIENKIDEYLVPPYSSILKSMIVGDKVAIDKDTKNNFVNSGLIHILVISGLHIGFCAAIFLFIFKIFGFKLKYVYLLTIPTLFFYTLMTGANPPAVRASIMASCVLIAFILDREPLIYNALSLSALIILIINPQSLFTASFQLSFFATFGIVYLYPKFKLAFGFIRNKFLSFVWDVACVTLSAQFALIPILIYYFGKISVVSFILNLIIVPLVPVIITLSLIFYTFSFVSSYAAASTAFILTYFLKFILCIIKYSSQLSFAVVYAAVPGLIKIIFYYFAFYIMLEYKKNKKLLLCVAFAALFFYVNPFKEQSFIKSFIGQKNITTHIKAGDKNFIFFDKIKEDRYYFDNLEQYLLAQGIFKIEHFQTNHKSKPPFKKITVHSCEKISNF